MGLLVADTGALKPAANRDFCFWVIPRMIEVFTVYFVLQPAINLFFGQFMWLSGTNPLDMYGLPV